MAAAIELRGAGKRYPGGLQALEPLDLTVEEGSFTVVMGASGAGKSTLIRLVNGLETATTGQVLVHGETLGPDTLRAVRARTGMVFQQFQLVERLSVMTNVLTGRLAHCPLLPSLLGLFPREDLDRAAEALRRVGLVDKAWQRADRLSGGQKQRVGIARALAQQPHLLLADEPVASLDPATAEDIMTLLREIHARDGITVLVSLHQPELARRHAARIIGLAAGRLVFDGVPAQLDEAALARLYGRAPGGSAT